MGAAGINGVYRSLVFIVAETECKLKCMYTLNREHNMVAAVTEIPKHLITLILLKLVKNSLFNRVSCVSGIRRF